MSRWDHLGTATPGRHRRGDGLRGGQDGHEALSPAGMEPVYHDAGGPGASPRPAVTGPRPGPEALPSARAAPAPGSVRPDGRRCERPARLQPLPAEAAPTTDPGP